MESIETKIYRKVKRADRGKLFFVNMFSRFGNAKAVNKALERLTQQEKQYRVADEVQKSEFSKRLNNKKTFGFTHRLITALTTKGMYLLKPQR